MFHRCCSASTSVSETPTTSPGISHHASPTTSPCISHRASPVPNSPASSAATSASRTSQSPLTIAHAYDTLSELLSVLGPKPPYGHPYPYHEQYPGVFLFASIGIGNDKLEGGPGPCSSSRNTGTSTAT
ncbi:hypothetical protein K438DRAFT_1971110 [Mycena galopus ATCC 62051]|nr:hypothetical protein K438DRAFT_1971110 [Mycena galopus ATCC 62051]